MRPGRADEEMCKKIIYQPLFVHVYITILSSVLHRLLYVIYRNAVLLYLLIILYVLLELLLRATAFENKHDTYLLTICVFDKIFSRYEDSSVQRSVYIMIVGLTLNYCRRG